MSFSGLGKKRTFRELERWDNSAEQEQFDDGCMARSVADREPGALDEDNYENVSVKTLKFNSRLLCKASAAVDLISQKIEFKNMMNQSVTGSFVTVILELTSDFIDKLEQQEQ
jgi:hypothetical protein